jgi:hypothetical protein
MITCENYELRTIQLDKSDKNSYNVKDRSFTFDDINPKLREKRCNNKTKYVKEKLRYFNRYFNRYLGKEKSLNPPESSPTTIKAKLKSTQYFVDVLEFHEKKMWFYYLTPKLFTFGAITVPPERKAILTWQVGEVWLYVKPQHVPEVAERTLDAEWFDSWDSFRMTEDAIETFTVGSRRQFFSITVEKSAFFITFTDDEDKNENNTENINNDENINNEDIEMDITESANEEDNKLFGVVNDVIKNMNNLEDMNDWDSGDDSFKDLERISGELMC